MALSDYFPFLSRPPARFVTESGEEVHGVMAEFDTPGAVYHAAEKVRDAGYKNWDVHTPFPIHGMEDAMGIRPTILPIYVAVGAFTGVGLAYLMQWWMTAVDFPIVVQGKPYDSWQPFVPITFELGVLFSAFSALLSMLALNGLPRFHHPLFKKERFLRVSNDRFVICIEAGDPKFDPRRTRDLLEQAGGKHIDLVEEQALGMGIGHLASGTRADMKTRNTSRRMLTLGALGACAAMAAVSGCRGDREDKPPRQFFPDMDDSPKFKAQVPAPFFADGRSMRPAVPGTVAFSRVSFDPVGYARADWAAPFLTQRTMLLREDKAFFEGMDDKGDFVTTIPVHVTREMIMRGQERFNIYCSACHGFSGNGQGMVGKRWLTAVANFHDLTKYGDPTQRTGKDGYLFHTIRYGVPEAAPGAFPKMPPYGQSVNEADAWAIVAYIRVLQAWQGGSIDQVPPSERETLVKQRDAYRAANPPAPPAPAGEPVATPPGGGTSK